MAGWFYISTLTSVQQAVLDDLERDHVSTISITHYNDHYHVVEETVIEEEEKINEVLESLGEISLRKPGSTYVHPRENVNVQLLRTSSAPVATLTFYKDGYLEVADRTTPSSQSTHIIRGDYDINHVKELLVTAE
ncbi:hypothetical protein [Alteribacter keqinensis]|uniref:hypothetical protein n=1 Tax=Alteribacter keqinensis TaxID=2483800 RepID=UPI00115D9591|nr:hypothetical protein [Alteribacter keqinensis]